MKKGIIFDMDGVIVDTEPMHQMVTGHVFDHVGIPYTQEEIHQTVGVAYKDIFANAIKKHGLDIEVKTMLDLQIKMAEEIFSTQEIPTIDPTIKLIKKLHDKKIKMAVASSSTPNLIRIILSRVGIIDYMDSLVSGYDVPMGKPFPDIFLQAASNIGASNEECVVIEDSPHGVTAANRAQIKVIGFLNPNTGNMDLSHATTTVKNMEEVSLDLLMNL